MIFCQKIHENQNYGTKQVRSIMLKNKLANILFLVFVIGSLMISCEKSDEGTTAAPVVQETVSDCIGCHTDSDMLLATQVEDSGPPPSSGEG